MRSPRRRLWCLVLLMLIALAGPGAPAQAAEKEAGSILSRVWAWLEDWFPWAVAAGEQCAGIDPNGGGCHN